VDYLILFGVGIVGGLLLLLRSQMVLGSVVRRMLSTKSNKTFINCLLCAYNSCISLHPLLVQNIIMCQNVSLSSALPWMFLLHPPLEPGE
jgi:hypothetical protein